MHSHHRLTFDLATNLSGRPPSIVVVAEATALEKTMDDDSAMNFAMIVLGFSFIAGTITAWNIVRYIKNIDSQPRGEQLNPDPYSGQCNSSRLSQSKL